MKQSALYSILLVAIVSSSLFGQTDLVAPYGGTPPAIDGVIGATEWHDAQAYSLVFHSNVDQTTVTTVVYFLNDGTFLYCASTVPFPSSPTAFFGVYIDGDNSNSINGVLSEPHIDLGYNKAGTSSPLYSIYDAYWAEVPPCGVVQSDAVTPPSGAAHAFSGTTEISYEFRMPLSDMTVGPGGTIGVHVMFSPGGAGYMYPSADYCDIASWPDLYIEPGSQPPHDGDILVYATCETDYGYFASSYDDDLPVILAEEGFSVDVTDRVMTPEITPTLLDNYSQLWIMSTDPYSGSGCFSSAEISAILDFRNAGNGILIMADDGPPVHDYTGDANQISTLFGVTFGGEYNYGPFGEPFEPDFSPHPLFDGVQTIVCTENTSVMNVSGPSEVVATYAGNNIIAILDDGKGRMVFDVSFVRLWDEDYYSGYVPLITVGNTPQYVKNIANWLDGGNAPQQNYNLEIQFYIDPDHYFDAGSTTLDMIRISTRIVNHEPFSLEHVRVSCQVSGTDAEVFMYAGSDGLLDYLKPGTTWMIDDFAAIKFLHRDNRNINITCSITSVNSIPVSFSDSKRLSIIYVTDNVNEPFTFSQDVYPFTNPRLDWNAVWKTFEVEPLAYIVALLSQWSGTCWGMATTSGEYFIDPTLKPVNKLTSNMLITDEGVRENLIRYHFSQVYQEEAAKLKGSFDQDEEADRLIGVLERNKPAVIAYDGGSFKHAVLCPKIVVDEDTDVMYQYIYDNQKDIATTLWVDWATYDYNFNTYSNGKFVALEPYQALSLSDIKDLMQNSVVAAISGLIESGLKSFSLACPARMVITTEDGRRLGYLDEQTFVNEIAQGEVMESNGVGSEKSVTYIVPQTTDIDNVGIYAVGEGDIHFSLIDPSQPRSERIRVINFDSVNQGFACRVFPNSSDAQIDFEGDSVIDSTAVLGNWVSISQGEIFGYVTASVAGIGCVQVTLVGAGSEPISTTVSDPSGRYEFDTVPNGDYSISISVPLGYAPVSEPVIAVNVRSLSYEVNFELTEVTTGKTKDLWWWSGRLADIKNGTVNEQFGVTREQVDALGQKIYEHFYLKAGGYAIQIPGLTCAGEGGSLTFDDIYTVFFGADKDTNPGKVQMNLLTVLLDVASGDMSQLKVVSEDGITVSQAINYYCSLYPTEWNDWTVWWNIMKVHCPSFGLIPAGVIPPSTPTVLYKESDEVLPTEFALSQNFPNPFNPVTEISYSLPSAADVSLDIYNVVGQKVASLPGGHKEAGTYSVVWDATEFASGVYFYRLTAGDYVETKKMLLLK